jgi:hypothetical protein
MDKLTPKVMGALIRHRWLNKAIKAAIIPAFERELNKEHCAVYCYRKKGDLYLFHEPDLDDTDQAYVAYLGGRHRDAVISQLDFNKVEILEEWDTSYRHPYVQGQESLNWTSLICSGCGRPNDDCDCCETCGYSSESGCECSYCSHCGENIDAGECNCTRCETCDQLIEDCDCEQPEDLPSVNDGPGDGPQFA